MSRAFVKERDDVPDAPIVRKPAAERPDPPARKDIVGFGATVVVQHGDDAPQTFTIVGEDETDIAHGRISFTSPLALALMGKSVGKTALWKRPAGNQRITIRSISYG